jgi:hypothetical protein
MEAQPDAMRVAIELWRTTVLDLVSQIRDVVLMNVYLDLGNPGGRDFGIRGI